MVQLAKRPWVPLPSEEFIQSLAQEYSRGRPDTLETEIHRLIEHNRKIHDLDCINLNPATNVMNPRAEGLLASGLATRPSLGYPGEKYEMGLEAIERIEVMAAELACETFDSHYAEIRVPSGSLANLYAFLATCRPGEAIIVPPQSIGGHITHHPTGAAGLYHLDIHPAPVDAANYTIDTDALRTQARQLRPKLITIGGSLNLFPHPIKEIRLIADEVGAYVLFDAAHLSGMIAGRAWQRPLEEGAHLMTMSTYKSLGGPPSGLIVTNDPHLAERLDHIAYPGLTANFDVAKTAALAITFLDWKACGKAYAAMMAKTAKALARALAAEGLPVFASEKGGTTSHQFAIEASQFGGGQNASKVLRAANILASGIGLPVPEVAGDSNGLRLGVPEFVRRGMRPEHTAEIARFINRALLRRESPESVAKDVSAFRAHFQDICFIRK
ncbi:MAG TPA: aminotransferase class I/II-fold pyridoxal phosphate-dependent enzyme [Anaerolineales bacterium]|nr:aminotransferase class I/II-fold pyridoxal phosphate-dependent enzyme [Anaerolineales bacterium]